MEGSSWQPSASITGLRQRAQMLALIRDFFNQRGYLEVETPTLSRFGITDPYLANIQAFFRGQAYQLQTSPEYHMKRLLAAGSGPIFQIAKAFRDDELGRWHNPEFTMLEWYQLDIDHHALMDEVDALLQLVLHSPPMLRESYQQLFLRICDIDPFATKVEELKRALKGFELDNVLDAEEEDLDQYLFLLMTHVIEPALSKEEAPVAVYHFPPSQAALAQVRNGVAERFEVYVRGVELANGFHELTNADAQLQRFQDDLMIRRQKGLPEPCPDNYLLNALRQGLPPCSGVALGIDRLLTLAFKESTIADFIAFDFSRA